MKIKLTRQRGVKPKSFDGKQMKRIKKQFESYFKTKRKEIL